MGTCFLYSRSVRLFTSNVSPFQPVMVLHRFHRKSMPQCLTRCLSGPGLIALSSDILTTVAREIGSGLSVLLAGGTGTC